MGIGSGFFQGATQPAAPASGLGGFDFSKLMENPEMLAIGLDMAGQSIGGPTTPFGGVGTALGQSSLANKARGEQLDDLEEWQKLIMALITGDRSMTPAGSPGDISSVSLSPAEQGKTNLDFSITPEEKLNENDQRLLDFNQFQPT